MTMRFAAATTLALLALAPGAAFAGPYTDTLGKCLVAHVTPADQETMVQFSFAGLSLQPSVKSFVTLSDLQRADLAHKAADMFQRLMTNDCHAEMVAALKNEGSAAVGPAFTAMGQSGRAALAGDPAVAAYNRSVLVFIDREKFQALFLEAGVSPGGAPASGAPSLPPASTPVQ